MGFPRQEYWLCCAVLSHSVVFNFVTPWTVAHKAPLSLGILQARILECVAMPSSRGSSQPKDQTQVSHIAGGFFTSWATGKTPLRALEFLCLVLKHGHAGGAGPSQSPPHFSSHLHSGPPHQGACSHTCGCASLYRQVLSTPRANSCPSLISGLGVHTSGGTIWLGVQALGVGLGLCGQRILYHLEDHLKEGPWALGLGKHSLGARGWQSWWREHSRSPAPSCLGLPLSSLLCTHCGGGGLVAKSYPTLTTSWTAARQAPLSMGFPRKE